MIIWDSMRLKIRLLIMLLGVFHAGMNGIAQEYHEPVKGSYLSFEQPAIEDNSFLIEEAFNQRMGVLQHIFNVNVNDFGSRDVTYSFTQEIPLTDESHQLSYSLNYQSHNPTDSSSGVVSGLSDIYVSYRPLLSDASRWAMVIPRFTIILPTGKSADGLGGGAFGFQFNLAITKRISNKLMTHYNFGYTKFFKYDSYAFINGEHTLAYERDLTDPNAGMSIVWSARQKVNFLLESVISRNGFIQNNGVVGHAWHHIVNPGVRFSINTKQMQLVPGISYQLDVNSKERGVFLYFSIEPDYENFYRKKLKR
jgi:hypothetical protein